jgi:histidinol phosphatase-like enzyme
MQKEKRGKTSKTEHGIHKRVFCIASETQQNDCRKPMLNLFIGGLKFRLSTTVHNGIEASTQSVKALTHKPEQSIRVDAQLPTTTFKIQYPKQQTLITRRRSYG